MLIPKKNRIIIYENLFKHGVMVAKKDFNAPKHCELEQIPNLQVIKAMTVRVNLSDLEHQYFKYFKEISLFLTVILAQLKNI